jgi:hypothetical protein
MRPNFFFSGLTFFAGLAEEYGLDLATVLDSRVNLFTYFSYMKELNVVVVWIEKMFWFLNVF